MKRVCVVLLSSFMCMLMLTCSVFAAEEPQVVKGTTDPWPPWIEGELGEEPTGGVGLNITLEIFTRANLTLELRLSPFKRCIEHIRTGTRDVILMVSKNAEREEFMEFTEPIIVDPYLIYYSVDRMESFEWNDWEELKPYTFGLTAGFNYGEGFANARTQYNIKANELQTDIQLLKVLLAGRVDLIILNRTTANGLLKAHPEFQGKMKPAAKFVNESAYYLGFSKKSPAVAHIPKINEAIRQIREDGTLEKILGGSNNVKN